MCGISAYLGNKDTINKLISSLKMLQNRGYDSAGICFVNQNKLINIKYASTQEETSITKIENKLENIKINNDSINTNSINTNSITNIGLAHTRWATHGGKTDINAHPHIDYTGKIALVHNGIIENYLQLKEFLNENNITCKSQTDSEVIVNLISFYKTELKDIKLAIKKTITQLQGTWGLVIIDLEQPSQLFACRYGSPLIIGKTCTEIMITSEISGFCNFIQDYFVLQEKDIVTCEYTQNGVKIIKDNIDYKFEKLDNSLIEIDKGDFKFWTIKEINEQPDSIIRSLNNGARLKDEYNVKLGGLNLHKNDLIKIDNLIILGCGTSLNAAQIGKKFFENYDLFNTVLVIDGAEFNTKMIPRNGKNALLLLSQSGETKDLHRCIEIGRQEDMIIMSIVNVVDSMIAREADCGIYLNAGREVGVASTKSFTSQLVVLQLMAIWFAQNKDVHAMLRKESIKDLRLLSNNIQNIIKNLESQVINFAHKILATKQKSLFILGKGKNQYIANEGALKIKELSYLHAEGYSGSALKHGPFALLEKDTPVIFIVSNDSTLSKMKNAIEEVKSREALSLVISDCNISNIDNIIVVPKNKELGCILSVVILQLLAYHLAILQNINPDFPRNLAKVVTVE
ncbi:SIS domain [seawater metagenome]|uniref:glutamine--fructose-6-phosphate transaminase (isomerizing) n=1 Tax=seawater metagenome TaxID=1561972 RepID=A0A5E8CLV2_9ZZZZ